MENKNILYTRKLYSESSDETEKALTAAYFIGNYRKQQVL
jgi:hypothetical protein